jgi:hypothetical protein
MNYYLYTSTGNTVGLDDYLSYSEIDVDGYHSRYLEISSSGATYRYSREHVADEHGFLPEGIWDDIEAAKAEYGTTAKITAELFTAIWDRMACDRSDETINAGGITYSFLIASDVLRDGLGLEVYRDGAAKELVMEVFRDDGKCQYLVSQFVPELPLALIEYVAARARKELGGFVC